MTGVRRSLRYTKPDAAVECLSTGSQSVRVPPDNEERTSSKPKSSAGDTTEDEEAESDSGDSLFITQQPVPEAVRSAGRRRHYSLRSGASSSPPRDLDLDESADESSSSDSAEEAERKRRGGKRVQLPRFNFSFLRATEKRATEKRANSNTSRGTVDRDTSLNTHIMGGFFLNVSKLSEGRQQGDNSHWSLPTVDQDGEDISPLSDGEDSGSESEDMKVVEKTRFVGRSKCSQPWCMKSSNGSREMQKKTTYQPPAKASTATSGRNTVAQTKTSRTNRRFTRGKEKIILQKKQNEEKQCDDSDATVCEELEQGPPQAREHPGTHTLNGRDASDPQADVFHTDALLQTGQQEEEDVPHSQGLLHSLPDLIMDINYDRIQDEPRVKKKKKKKKAKGVHEGVEGEKGQSQEEPEGRTRHAAASVSLETEEIPSLSEDNPAEPPAAQTSDEPELNEGNSSHDGIPLREGRRHSPDSKQPKKKSAADNGGEERDGNAESDVRLESNSVPPVMCDDNKEEKKKKKKKKKKRERNDDGEEGIEPLPLSTVSEPASDDVETQGKKEKRKKEKMVVNVEEAVNVTSDQLEASGERLENHKKRKKKSRQMSASHDDGQVGGEGGGDVGSPHDVTLEESTEQSMKKKKRRERNDESEKGIEQFTVSEPGSDDVEIQGKKKKRKKEKMVVNVEEPEEAVNVTSDQLEASGERLENHKKRKKKRKQKSASDDEVQVGGEDGADVGSPHDVTLEESTEQSMKKKKKKKKKESIPEEEDISSTPDKSEKVNGAAETQTTEEGHNDQDAEVVSKEKKKKKKKSEIFSGKVSEDALTQTDDSVSVRKKEKKKRTSSFLVADAEEKDAQTQDKQSSTSVAARVWDAQKLVVSAGDVETESAEIGANAEASNDGSRKKKRKREKSVAQESVEQDHELDFKKTKETCLSSVPETNDTGVKKKKKKRKRSNSESVTSIETFISSSEAARRTDEAVEVKKKKKRKKGSSPAATDDAESEEAVQRSCSSASHEGEDKQSTVSSPSPVAVDVKEKKKKKKVKSTDDVFLESEPSTECAKIKTHKTKSKDTDKLMSSPSVRSSSKEGIAKCASKNTSKKTKRKLYNQNVDFLGDG